MLFRSKVKIYINQKRKGKGHLVLDVEFDLYQTLGKEFMVISKRENRLASLKSELLKNYSPIYLLLTNFH